MDYEVVTQVVSLVTKAAKGEQIATADQVSLGISTVLVEAAWVADDSPCALGCWRCVIYGEAELLSFAATGKSLEQIILENEKNI